MMAKLKNPNSISIHGWLKLDSTTKRVLLFLSLFLMPLIFHQKKQTNKNFSKFLYVLIGIVLLIITIQSALALDIRSCQTLNNSTIYTLNQSVNASGTCFTIKNNSIEIDCAGYNITYSETDSQYNTGIDINNNSADSYDNITVRNCKIISVSQSANDKAAIAVYNSTNNSFINNSLHSNGNNFAHGFLLSNVNQSRVINNTINSSCTGTSCMGIWLERASSYINITGNYISTNGSDQNYGIALLFDTNHILVESNTILTNGSSNLNDGVFINNSRNNTIYKNNITAQGGSGLEAVRISFSSTDNILRENHIVIRNIRYSGGSSSVGIYASANSSNNIFINNNVTVPLGELTFDSAGLGQPAPFNYLVYNNSFGEIRWVNNSTGSFLADLDLNVTNTDGFGLGRNLFISNTTVALNMSAFAISKIKINRSSVNITFSDTWLTDVNYILQDRGYIFDDDSIRQTGTDCYDSGCNLNTLSNGDATVNISNFEGSYTLDGTGKLNESHTVYRNINSSGSGFNITQSNLILNCQSYNLTYGTDTTGVGIDNTDGTNSAGNSNITIRGCNITKGAGAGNNNFGISSAGQNNTLENNTITTTGALASYGIFLLNSINNKVANNTINTNGSGTAYGIIFQGTNQTWAYNNTIITDGTGSNNNGIHVSQSSLDNNVTQNSLKVFGTGTTHYGIHLLSTSDRWIISNNTIFSNGSSNFNVGINTINGDNLTISNNVITSNGTNNSYGLQIPSTSTGNLIQNNIITATGINNLNDGITVASSTNRFYNNNITQSDNGITFNDTTSGGGNELIYNNSFGHINWSSGGLDSNISLIVGNDIFIINGTVGLTDSATALNLDGVAFIELRQRNEYRITPQLLKDGTRCDNTNACNISWDNTTKILMANISSFSNYSTSASPFCGDLSTDTTLNASVSTGGTCFTITSNNINLNCDGNTITYGTTTVGYGINNSVGYDNITVRNCIINKGSTIGSGNYGIYMNSSANNTILNNTIHTDGNGTNHGILFSIGSNSSRIQNNTIRTNGTGSSNYGISFNDRSSYTNITGNTIYTNGTTTNIGIAFTQSGDATIGNIVNNNTITATGNGSDNSGIVPYGSDNVNITNNVITASGTSSNVGIDLSGATSVNLVENNTIITNGTGATNYGIHLSNTNSTIKNNIINTSGTNNNYGIFNSLCSGCSGNVLQGNNIIANGSGSRNSAIRIEVANGASQDNIILNNNLTSLGGGFSLDHQADDGTMYNVTLIYNNSFGQINWTSGNLTTNITLELNNTVFIQNNLIGLTGNPESLRLNSSASLSFFDIDYGTTNVRALKNGEVCTTGSQCNISYDTTTQIFLVNVTSFSNYSTGVIPDDPGGSGGGGGGYIYGENASSNITFKTFTYAVGDGVCHYSLGETKIVSPNDCKPNIENYLGCLLESKSCLSREMWVLVIAITLICVLLLVNMLFFRGRK